MGRWGAALRMMMALLAPLALWGCVLTPGAFTSTLTVNADRTFTYAYQGEVIAIDFGKEFAKGMGGSNPFATPEGEDGTEEDDDAVRVPSAHHIAWQEGKADGVQVAPGTGESATAGDQDGEARNHAIAEALAKEPGYRSVRYLGDGKFMVDYRLSGTLTHSFVFPYNLDAEAVFPFVVMELRPGGAVRVRAPAFGSSDKASALPGTGEDGAASKRNGTFTLETDAEIVSQNNEDGATAAGSRRRIVWRVSPLTRDAPSAVLKLRPPSG